jgi:hypothetical protein
MESEQKEQALAEQAQADVEKSTRDLRITSSELFEARKQFSAWKLKLEELIKTRGTVEVRSHDSRNYHQTFHFIGKTEAGENPIVGEFDYGDDFHKGDGTPKLQSYTSYIYGTGKGKEVERFSNKGDGSMYSSYHEEVKADGWRTVTEQQDKDWITTQYDPEGNKIEK